MDHLRAFVLRLAAAAAWREHGRRVAKLARGGRRGPAGAEGLAGEVADGLERAADGYAPWGRRTRSRTWGEVTAGVPRGVRVG